jgi:putative transposase
MIQTKEFPTAMVARVLELNRSTLYLKRSPDRPLRDLELALAMLAARQKHPCYGFRRIFLHLTKKQGLKVNKKRVYRVYAEYRLQLKRKKRKRHWHPLAEAVYLRDKLGINLISDIVSDRPYRIIRGDFTELRTVNGKYYFIAYVCDYSKKVLGWALGRSPDADTALAAARMALEYAASDTYFHQDQGSAFTSEDYVTELTARDVFISYSEKGTPTDNGAQESFFGRFKDEWRDRYYWCKSFNELYQLIDTAITYYNTQRIHTTIKDTPEAFLKAKSNRQKSV